MSETDEKECCPKRRLQIDALYDQNKEDFQTPSKKPRIYEFVHEQLLQNDPKVDVEEAVDSKTCSLEPAQTFETDNRPLETNRVLGLPGCSKISQETLENDCKETEKGKNEVSHPFSNEIPVIRNSDEIPNGSNLVQHTKKCTERSEMDSNIETNTPKHEDQQGKLWNDPQVEIKEINWKTCSLEPAQTFNETDNRPLETNRVLSLPGCSEISQKTLENDCKKTEKGKIKVSHPFSNEITKISDENQNGSNLVHHVKQYNELSVMDLNIETNTSKHEDEKEENCCREESLISDQLDSERMLIKQQFNDNEELNNSTKRNLLYSRKDDHSVKCNTEHGNEYQRLIQILLRNRGFEISDFKLGFEVKKVGDLDDIVCCYMGNTCRFIQVKHEQDYEAEPTPQEDLEMSQNVIEIPKDNNIMQNFESPQQLKSPHNKETPEKTSDVVVLHRLFETSLYDKKPNFEIVRYFKSFCKIKKHETFGNADIEEIIIVTNRPLHQDTGRRRYQKTLEKDKYQEFLNLRDDFENDEFLYLDKESGKKYSLNVDALIKKHTVFMDCLRKIYHELETSQGHQQNPEEFITEFLKKIRIVVDYPPSADLKELVFKEVLDKHDLNMEGVVAGNCLIHNEIEQLVKRGKGDEFLSSEGWKKIIEELKQEFEGLKYSAITRYKTDNFLNNYRSIEFDVDKTEDMCEGIRTFLNNNEKYIFHLSNVQNEKLAAVKTFNIIDQIRDKKNGSSSKECYAECYADLHDLIQGTFLPKYFLSGRAKTLILTAGNSKNKVSNEDDKVEELANKLVCELNKTNNKKLIIISTSNNIFSEKIRDLSGDQYLEKTYIHSFSCLSKESKEEILSKQILFQGQTIKFGSLFNNDQNFANNVIDDDILLKIYESMPCLSDTTAFVSPGYNENYYINRDFVQKIIQIDVVKERMQEELFFITPTNGVGNFELKEFLLESGISPKHIKELPKKPKRGKRQIEKNGIILKGLEDEQNEKIFKEIAGTGKNNITVHWLHLWGSSLIHVDSLLKSSDGEALKIIPNYVSEFALLDPQLQQKILIVVGDSGVGKSTVLTYIANNKRSINIPVWIVKVNLRKFYRKNTLKQIKQIGYQTEIDSTINIIAEMGSLSDSSKIIAKTIIKEGLKKSQEQNFNMVLLLDGFNEIGPRYQDKTCNLIKTLISECNIKQIWISTQHQEKLKLESELGIPAYTLEPLDDERQIRLMVKYWIAKYNLNDPRIEYDEYELKADAQRAIQTWKKSIHEKDDQSFTQVCLNLIILSDILWENNRQIKKNIDLISLYETFTNKRFSIYSEEVSDLNTHRTEIEPIKEEIFKHFNKEILQELSVSIILTSYQNDSATKKLSNNFTALRQFQTLVENSQNNEYQDTYLTILSKIGFLSVKGGLDFTHESFTQYFFSNYLFNNLDEPVIKKFFVKHVICETNLYLCCKFLNNLMEKHYKQDKEKIYQDIFKHKQIKPLPFGKKSINVKTCAVTKILKDKLDYVVILLLHLIGTQFSSFLGQWVRDEVNFEIENGELRKQIVGYLRESRISEIPSKFRRILKVKSQNDSQTVLKKVLEQLEYWNTGDDESQD